METIGSIENKINEYLILKGINPDKATPNQIVDAYDAVQLEQEKKELKAIRRERIRKFWRFKWIQKEDLIVALIWFGAWIGLIAFIWHINK